MNRHSRLCVFITILILIPTVEVNAARQKQPKSIDIANTKVTIAPYLTGGWLVGDVADHTMDNRKFLYGFGVHTEYKLKTFVQVGLGSELLTGKFADDDRAKVRGISFSVSSMWLARPANRSSLYLRLEYGIMSLDATGLNEDDAGSHAHFRIAIGNRIYSSSWITTRVEAYYRQVFTSGYIFTSEQYNFDVDFDIKFVGIQFGFGFGL